MKNTDANLTPPATNAPSLAAIDIAALDDVTGGCAACGSPHATGQDPTANPDATRPRSFDTIVRS